MLDRRRTRPSLVVVAALAMLGPCLPAHADPGNPTPSEIAKAHQEVAGAQHAVQSLQVQAERAAEQYNGALTHYENTHRVSVQAASRAAVARAAQARSQGIATGAQAVATAAQAKAAEAKDEQVAAEASVAASQKTLNAMAYSAYESGGSLSMVGQLLTTSDPALLVRSQGYISSIGAFQQSVIDDLTRDRVTATLAAQFATKASATAASSNAIAQAALHQADQARDSAVAARNQASSAAAAANHALWLAGKAKGRALHLVARAEALLGSAKQRARHLEQAAAAARAAAQGVHLGHGSSEAANIAIHWAYQEIGTPYSWGGGDENGPTYGFAQGSGTRGFDCSGLTLFAYGHAGIHLDHYTGSQWNEGKRISSRSELQPGDLMFFAYDTSDASTIHHVSIYIGNGQMIEAPYTGSVVRVSSADRSDFIGGTRPWA